MHKLIGSWESKLETVFHSHSFKKQELFKKHCLVNFSKMKTTGVKIFENNNSCFPFSTSILIRILRTNFSLNKLKFSPSTFSVHFLTLFSFHFRSLLFHSTFFYFSFSFYSLNFLIPLSHHNLSILSLLTFVLCFLSSLFSQLSRATQLTLFTFHTTF